MNWQRVIRKLRMFAQQSHDSAHAMLEGYHPPGAPVNFDEYNRRREQATILFTIAVCLEDGLEEPQPLTEE